MFQPLIGISESICVDIVLIQSQGVKYIIGEENIIEGGLIDHVIVLIISPVKV